MTRLPCLRAVAASIALAVALPTIAQTTEPASAPRRFERLRQLMGGDLEDGTADDRGSRAAPTGTRIVRDVSYGPDPTQRFDVYVSTQPPAGAAPAPALATKSLSLMRSYSPQTLPSQCRT